MSFEFFKKFPNDAVIRILDNDPKFPMYVTIEEAERLAAPSTNSCPFCDAGISLKGKNDD